ETAAHPSTQQSSEKQGLPVDLKPGVTPGNSTSIIENLQGFALSKSMGIEGGAAGGKAQGGMGQGGTFLGNTAFQLSNLPSNEGSSAMQKTATDFRALMNAGRVIPDEGAVLRQVSQQLRAWRSGQDEPIRFLLEPKNLGRIQIDVSLKEGGLTAHMVTSDPMVKELLERNQHFLQEALKEQGLEMQQFSVDLGDKKGFARDAENTQGFTKSDVSLEEADARDSIQRARSELQSEAGGLSLYI
ncbi:MAG: flagellar hook-length control protein FliK, partial [Nitrospirota bacterium]|nr:flagellar hook-length control protein FliK [Nitrospirota bacterium]